MFEYFVKIETLSKSSYRSIVSTIGSIVLPVSVNLIFLLLFEPGKILIRLFVQKWLEHNFLLFSKIISQSFNCLRISWVKDFPI